MMPVTALAGISCRLPPLLHLLRLLLTPADVYCDRRLPSDVRTHEVLLGECLGGALAVNDFVRLCQQVCTAVLLTHAIQSARCCVAGPSTQLLLYVSERMHHATVLLSVTCTAWR